MPTPSLRENETLLCPACLEPIELGAHFCGKCTAPLTSHAATNRIGRIWAQGYAYRQGVRNPRSRLILWGLWLIFSPIMFIHLRSLWFTGLAMVSTVRRVDGGFSGYGFATQSMLFLFALAVEVLCGAILFVATRNYLRQRAGNDANKSSSQ